MNMQRSTYRPVSTYARPVSGMYHNCSCNVFIYLSTLFNINKNCYIHNNFDINTQKCDKLCIVTCMGADNLDNTTSISAAILPALMPCNACTNILIGGVSKVLQKLRIFMSPTGGVTMKTSRNLQH